MTLANQSRGTRDGAEFVQMVLTRLHPIEVFAKWFYSFLVGVILVVAYPNRSRCDRSRTLARCF